MKVLYPAGKELRARTGQGYLASRRALPAIAAVNSLVKPSLLIRRPLVTGGCNINNISV
ncbi:MAG: hypothetical protein P1P83_13730 [Bacteroidales bacterium]|nr:hypothetical protein [Bacteroidales bacterium]MDT8374208.1 hypothetical protein [Bacteroidales bacterium]